MIKSHHPHDRAFYIKLPTCYFLTRKKILAQTVITDMLKQACSKKAVPLQAWTGPQGSRTLRLPDF
jgi:hypothetical protein